MKFNDFMNIDVDLKDFTDTYNKYTNNKKNFGNGKMKLKDLINVYLKKLKLKKIKGGGENNNNLFYSMRYDTNGTDVLTMNDYKYNGMLFPSITNVNRS